MNQALLTAEMGIRFIPDWETGDIRGEVVFNPAGDIAAIAGFPRLVQHVTRFLLTQQGSIPGNADYGNPALGGIGAAGSSAEELARTMLDAATAWFARQSELHIEEAPASLTLLGASFEPNRQAPRYLKLTFMVTSKAGSAEQVALPFKLRAGQALAADISAIDEEPLIEEEEEAEEND